MKLDPTTYLRTADQLGIGDLARHWLDAWRELWRVVRGLSPDERA